MNTPNISKMHDMLLISTFGMEEWGNSTYRIVVHGPTAVDIPTPHIDVLNKDVLSHIQFHFEISFEDLLCNDEINLIYQFDSQRCVLNACKEDCSWMGYKVVLDGLKKYLFGKVQLPLYQNIFIDNLDVAIYVWNSETDFAKTKNGGNPLKEYLDNKGLSILPKYMKYLQP